MFSSSEQVRIAKAVRASSASCSIPSAARKSTGSPSSNCLQANGDPTFIETIQASDDETIVRHLLLPIHVIQQESSSSASLGKYNIHQASTPSNVTVEKRVATSASLTPESINPLIVRKLDHLLKSLSPPENTCCCQKLNCNKSDRTRWIIFLGVVALLLVLQIVALVVTALTLAESRDKVKDVWNALNNDVGQQAIDLLNTLYWESREHVDRTTE